MTTLAMRNLRTSSLLCHGLLKQQFLPTFLLRLPSPQRCPSSTSAATTALKASDSLKPLSDVNGPLSTLPAPLALPVRQPNQSFFPTYAFNLGRAYASFYKTGVLNIYKNFQASRPLKRTLSKYNSPPSALSQAVSAGALTRSDFQLLFRNWHDIKRIPIFALVFFVCGEFTPLVVIAISNIVPWTCRIPKQIAKDRAALEARRLKSFRNLTVPPPTEGGVEKLRREQLMHINDSLGLSSTAWDNFDALLWDARLERKVRARVEYLKMDDRLIREHPHGLREMEQEEVRMACVERGINVLGHSEKHLRGELAAWLKSAEQAPVERLLLTRSSVWPVQPVEAKD